MLSKFKFAILGFFLLLSVLCFDAYAQSEAEIFTAKNTVFVEAGGSGRYAASYGRIFHQRGKFKLSGSAGFSMWHYNTRRSTYWLPVLPLEISALLGKSKHHLELGTGITSFLEATPRMDPVTSEVSDKIVFSTGVPIRIGYRYQKPEGGFFFRVGYTPYFYFPGDSEGNIIFHPIFAGLSIGMSF